MDYIFLGMAALALLHFIYEGIIGPSLRMQCRNELFRQRDALRRLKIEGHPDSKDPAYNIIHDGINGYLGGLSGVTLHFMWKLRAGIRSEKYKEETQARLKILRDCESEKLTSIGKSMGRVIERAFMINSAAWLFYVVPIAVFAFFLHLLSKVMIKVIALPVDWSGKLLQKEVSLSNGNRSELYC